MKSLHQMQRPLRRLGIFLLILSYQISVQALYAAIERTFEWESFGETETLHLQIPEALQGHYMHKPRTYNYPSYVLEDAGYELNGKLAQAFQARAQEEHLNDWELLNMVVDFVQSLEYQSEVGEYPKYPVETLLDGGGDCEDTAILLAAILDKLGIDCIMLSPPGHMAVGVAVNGIETRRYNFNGRSYYYVETTGKNWSIGAIPPNYSGAAKIYPIPGDGKSRRAITAKADAKPIDNAEVTNILVSFYRAASGQEDPKTKMPLYLFQVHLDADEAVLSSISEVQYRFMTAQAQPDPSSAWMRAYDAGDAFRKDWVDTGYRPVQVRIFFKEGGMMETTVNFSKR